MKNFALIGAAGYIAPRHMEAIRSTGNRLIAAVDPHDSVGVIDRYFPDSAFFTEIERFDRHLEKLRRIGDDSQAHYVTICSPNYLHDAHIRLSLRVRAHAICEKPLALAPWNLDGLKAIEDEGSHRVYSVLQLRVDADVVALRKKLSDFPPKDKANVEIAYITPRGSWYQYSWKGSREKSGGVMMNLGIHFFDLVLWLFGPAEHADLHLNDNDRAAGTIELERACVKWFLSTSRDDLPRSCVEEGKTSFRSIAIDGCPLEFSTDFTELHNRVYSDILSGGGYGIDDARPAIDLVHRLQSQPLVVSTDRSHPTLKFC